MQKHNPNYDGKIKFWNMHKQLLPLGFMKELKVSLQQYCEYKKLELNLNVVDRRGFNEDKVEYKTLNTELRGYQKDAVEEFLRNKISMLEVATGGGKSLIMTEIVKRLGYKTLIVVGRLELLNQLKGVLEKELETEVGVIASGEYNPKHITISTIQTLAKDLKKYKEYLSTVRFSIVDECHHINSNSFWKLHQYLVNTEYRLGLSGTARRFDGNDMYLNAACGYIVYNLNAEKLIDMGYLTKPKIMFIKEYMTDDEIKILEYKSKGELINPTNNYNSFYENFIVNNKKRNNIVKDIVDKNKGKQILILTKRIEHANIISQMIDGNLLYGSTEKDIRKDLLEDFKNKKINILVGTIGIFQEGLDITALEILINCAGNKSDIASVQILGRLLRKTQDKKTCEYYDFIDESKFFRSASRSRIKAFKVEAHEVEHILVEEI
jgi:superfamily II DNA or RNA helicase